MRLALVAGCVAQQVLNFVWPRSALRRQENKRVMVTQDAGALQIRLSEWFVDPLGLAFMRRWFCFLFPILFFGRVCFFTLVPRSDDKLSRQRRFAWPRLGDLHCEKECRMFLQTGLRARPVVVAEAAGGLGDLSEEVREQLMILANPARGDYPPPLLLPCGKHLNGGTGPIRLTDGDKSGIRHGNGCSMLRLCTSRIEITPCFLFLSTGCRFV